MKTFDNQWRGKGIKKKKEIAAQFGTPLNSLSTILKNKEELLRKTNGEQLSSKRKRIHICLYEDVGDDACTMGTPSDEDILQSVMETVGVTDISGLIPLKLLPSNVF